MEPHSQAALADGPAGRPRPPVPLDPERRGHPVGRAGEGLATMAGVDAGGGGLLFMDVRGYWRHRRTACHSAYPQTPLPSPSPSPAPPAPTIHHQLQADVTPQASCGVPQGQGVDARTGLCHLLEHQNMGTVAPGHCLSVLVPGPGKEFRGLCDLHPSPVLSLLP